MSPAEGSAGRAVGRHGAFRAGRARANLLAVAAAVLALPTSARGQWTVYDPANYAENVLQYSHQLMQIDNQVRQLAYQLQALRKLRIVPGRDVRPALAGIAGAMAGANSLGYASPGADHVFQNVFPVTRPVADWRAEQRARAVAAVGVLRAAMLATARQQASVAPGAQAIEQMKAMNRAVQGHEQALELQNTAAVYAAEELMLLRQAAMAQTNVQAVYFAHRLNDDAQRDETVRARLEQLAIPAVAPADVSLRVGP